MWIVTVIIGLCFFTKASGEPEAAFVDDGSTFDIKQVNAGRKISSFSSYKDVVLTEYIIPPESQAVVWGFASSSNPPGCSSDKSISIYLQHGGYPLVAEAESKFSNAVFANKTDVAYLEIPANGSTWKLSIPAPRSGRWYSAVLIKQPPEHRYKQLGLHTKCEVMYFSSFLNSPREPARIETLDPGQRGLVREAVGRANLRVFKICLNDYVDLVEVTVDCVDACPVRIRARSGALPILPIGAAVSGFHELMCQDSGNCKLSYRPLQKTCQYVHVNASAQSSDSVAVYSLTVSAVKCQVLAEGRKLGPQVNKTSNDTYYPVESAANPRDPFLQPKCPYIVDLARLDTGSAFTSSFGFNHHAWPQPEKLFIPKGVFSDTIMRFEILPSRDAGGTLFVSLNLTDTPDEILKNMDIVACLNFAGGSRFDVETSCAGVLLKLNATVRSAETMVPFPEIGTWQLNLQGKPLVREPPPTSRSNTTYIPLQFVIKMTQCANGGCNAHGNCRISLHSGIIVTSSCQCVAGWKGWDCSNGDKAESTQDLLIAIFFLTISNLVFLPAAFVAFRRKYYTEALVYFFTCFFSSFYHACDQPLKGLAMCMMDFGVLQFCDFYVSILSFWVTMIAMADLPFTLKSLAHMLGAIGIALGVEYEKTGIWVFAVPALTGIAVLAASWGFRSYRLKQLSPHRRYWLVHFLPGFLFAALGLILFAFVETKDNYKFVHSVWHIAMALAVICFLPPPAHRHNGKYPRLRAIGTADTLSTSISPSVSPSLTQELNRDAVSETSREEGKTNNGISMIGSV